VEGHPGHHLLRQDFEKLADLAKAVAQNPVKGATGYKPVNSDAGGDLYLMDYIGMFGISFVPDSKYPENSEVILLPTQAAADREILPKVLKSLDKGAKIIMTTGFLANAADGQKLAELAGVKWPLTPQQTTSETVIVENKPLQLKFPVSMDYQIIANGANVLLQTTASQPFMTQNKSIYVINPHTFSQVDFDAVGEVLLCPRQIGLLELPKPWVNTLRSAFHSKEEPVLDAPSRVSMQQLADQSFIIHNYTQEKTEVNIQLKEGGSYIDGFTGKAIPLNGNEIRLEMAPRSRIWVREKK
jgi:hypothetical protein